MIAESLLLLALSHKPAFCSAPIIVTEARYPIAYYDYANNEIVLSTQLKRYEVKHAILHEAGGHCVEDEYEIEIPKYFGKPPFITEYSATSKHEAFAEAMAFELAGKRVTGPKGRFVRDILRKIK